mmetsp:Transcript_6435/g.5530  ORF Transcript_6435/g.5530 Transcript_6435/m.5530 type:complete len:214 (+) Transcript_6435:163-804(+)
MVDLFNHATELDKKSNDITKLFNERDKLIRNLTTNLYLLVEDIKKSEYLSGEAKKNFLIRSESLFNIKDSDTTSVAGQGEIESLKSNLDIFKSNEIRRASETRKSLTNTTISPEEMTKLKNRLVTMIKSEQEEKPFKKILKKKLAKYEQRLKNRTLISMNTQGEKHFNGRGESPIVGLEEEKKEQTIGIQKFKFGKKRTMLKKRNTMTKKSLL